MKKFFDELADWIWVVALLALVFLFYGDPDVWDRLHDKAMGVKCIPAPSASAEPK